MLLNDDDLSNSKLTVRELLKESNERKVSEKTNEKVPDKQNSHTTKDLAFVYDFSGHVVAFLKMTEDFVMRCPKCQIKTKYIIRHLSSKQQCKNLIDLQVFKQQFKMYKRDKEKKDDVIRKRRHREKLMKLDGNKAKRDNAQHQRTHRIKMMKLDEKKAKADNAEHQRVHREKMIKLDENKVKELGASRQRLSLCKRKAEDHQSLKNDQNTWQNKHRKIETASDRLCAFKDATLYNAIFVCTCCHQRMFRSNVRIFTTELENQINREEPGLCDKCIEKPNILTEIDGQYKCYICLTCVRHMKNQKLPPMSEKNNLTLTESDTSIKDQNLELTELEGALIAKNIIFQKIFQLPKSRWTALKDRVVNVPIKEDSIINTLDQLPRTPQAAGLIGVALKRKVEYKNAHKHQLIDPDKIF